MKMNQYTFPRKLRITKKSDFNAIYSTGTKKTVGPLLIHKKRNTLGYSRLGLSVPKRVGNTVQRNSIKRRCREAFRQSQFDFTSANDILITVRPHTVKELSSYIELIIRGVQ